MSQYTTSLPNSIFMAPLEKQQTPLHQHIIDKKMVLKGRIIKQKKTVKKPKQDSMLEVVRSESKNEEYLDSQEGNKDKGWRPRLHNAYIKGEKQRIRSKLDYVEEIDSDLIAILHLKCSSVFTRRYERSNKTAISKQTKSQLLCKVATMSNDQTTTNTINKDQKQKGQQEVKVISKNNTRIRRTISRRSVQYIDNKTAHMRVSQTISPSKNQSSPTKSTINKPLLRYNAQQLSNIKAESYCVIESTGTLVLNFRGHKSCQIASLTKIMTAYLIIRIAKDNNINLATQKFQVQQYVEYITGTSAQLIHGDIFSIEQLLYALLLPSGNDAALVLADWGGKRLWNINNKITTQKQNISKFVQQMTTYARKLGLNSTRYGNPHGLPHPQGVSTASDQCKLAALCLQQPLLSKIFKTHQYSFQITNSDNRKRRGQWQNTNKLLRREGFIGLKTGITVTAGPCLITAYNFKDKTYIATVLRSSKISRRFKDSRRVLHWVLCKLYSGTTTFQQTFQLQNLKKNDKYLDSDYSQDQHQFKYGKQGGAQQLVRRNKILINQL